MKLFLEFCFSPGLDVFFAAMPFEIGSFALSTAVSWSQDRKDMRLFLIRSAKLLTNEAKEKRTLQWYMFTFELQK